VAPFAWPRTEEPAWVEITPLEEAAFENEEDLAPEPAAKPESVVVAAAGPPDGITILSMAPGQTEIVAQVRSAGPGESEAAAAPLKSRDPTRAPAKPKPKGPLLVEYLNAYCPHCRKTLKRLEGVLASSDGSMRMRRVYTWSSKDYPLWARACAHAQTVGLEEEMFQELLKSRGQNKREVYAAARRAGLDIAELTAAVTQARPPERLVRDRRIVQRARIRMLPTIDIGRRRLQGEQSASELREAVQVATRQYASRAN
jgi:protein-disulfide isomerase